MSAIEIRAVVFGALTLLTGYMVWAAAATVLADLFGLSVPAGVWFLLSLIGAAGPVAAGYVGARASHSRRLLHGVLAAVVGAAIVLAALAAFGGLAGIYGALGALIASAVLSLVGAVFVVRKPVQVGP